MPLCVLGCPPLLGSSPRPQRPPDQRPGARPSLSRHARRPTRRSVGACRRVSGTRAIDQPGERESELIPATPEAARATLAPWLQTGFWFAGDGGNNFTFFMLGVAIHLGRPIAVIERHGSTFLDPARVYGARDAQGALVRTSGKGAAPVTIPAFKCMPLAMLLEKLRASPTAYSLVEYNGSNHFSPWIYKSDGSQPPAAALAARARGGEAEAKPPFDRRH